MDFDSGERWYRWRVSYEDSKPFLYLTDSNPDFIGTVSMACYQALAKRTINHECP